MDPTRAPAKAVFLYGPSRSGKSTILRLATAIYGPSNTSAVTLHQLATERFAAADLRGKLLNVAGDLSSKHVDDLSVFKLLTGEDAVRAEKKFQQGFTFTNRAVLVFAANEVPSIGEASGAYVQRMKPFRFAASFAGWEDPAVEAGLMAELPGILVRWVTALLRLRARGQHLPTEADVAAEFEGYTDRVRLFVAQCTAPDERGTRRSEVYQSYCTWVQAERGQPLGRNKFFARLRDIGVAERQDETLGKCFRIRLLPDDGDEPDWLFQQPDPTAPAGTPASPPDSSDSSPSTSAGVHAPGTKIEKQGKGRPKTVRTVSRGPAPAPALAFDLETGPAGQLFTYRPHDEQGFVRLAAYGDVVTTDVPALIGALERAEEIVAHNGLGYDLLALARHHGADYAALAAKMRDTLVLARLADPPVSRMTGAEQERRYGLNELANKFLGEQKSDALPHLGAKYGGFDRIPLDDPTYRSYAQRDVALTAGLVGHLPMTDYGRREHRVMTIAGRMSLSGVRVDERQLAQQLAAQRHRREQLLQGIPGLRDATAGHTGPSPHQTRPGRRHIAGLFQRHGVRLPPTGTGEPDLSGEQMDRIVQQHGPLSPAGKLAGVVRELNAQGSLARQVSRTLVDGRVHPFVDARQATGRWSITNPGLTTVGKRGERVNERKVFIPEPGEVFLAADLSQIDARAVAAHCQDPRFMELFDEGRDLHAEVAEQVLGDRAKRDLAKKLNHSVNYGVGAQKLAEEAGVPVAEAQAYLTGMAERFPGWAAWRQGAAERAAAGEFLDNGFGRKLRVDPERARTAGPAAIGQSCARDLLMERLLIMEAAGLTSLLRMVIHDEVLLSVPVGDYEEVARTVLDCLTFDWAPPGATRSIKIRAEVGIPGDTWAGVYG